MSDARHRALCEARLGTTLKGKWVLEKLVGVGGMAAVYSGAHKIGRRDAIKILHPEVAKSAELRTRFEQEAAVANSFSHPGAVEIRDIDVSEDGCPFLVMEFLQGETLGEWARRLYEKGEAFPIADLLRFTEELLSALDAAHAQGIVHRDIKLDNVFITETGSVKVLDFGIARFSHGRSITVAGARLGTAAYMAPEQVRGEPVDGRADLFSVGATLFRLLAMRRIHEVSSEADLFIKMGTEPAPKLLTVALKVDPELAAIVDRALAFKAGDRYPSAGAMIADVQRLRTRALEVTAQSNQRREPDLNRTVPLNIAMLRQGGAAADNLSPDSTTAARPAERVARDEAPNSMSRLATNQLAGQAATQAMSIAQLTAAAAPRPGDRSAASASSARNGTVIQPTPQPPAAVRSPSSGSSASNQSFVGSSPVVQQPSLPPVSSGPVSMVGASMGPVSMTGASMGPMSMTGPAMGHGVGGVSLAALRETNPPRSGMRDAAPPFAAPNAEWVQAAPGVAQLQPKSGGGGIWIVVAVLLVAILGGAAAFFLLV
jgi:serine/threonine protein kinase